MSIQPADSLKVVLFDPDTGLPYTASGDGGGDATAANQTAGNATLTGIDGHVDGLEASAASIDTKLTSQATAANQTSHLKFGATASVTSYTVQLAAGGYYELPVPIYTGAIDGIWAAVNGAAMVTEAT